MTAERDDNSYLWDMLTAARAVEGFIRGRTDADYLADLMLRSAVERQIEIIGEATIMSLPRSRLPTPRFLGGRSRHSATSSPMTMAKSDMSEFGAWPRCISRS